MLRTLDLAGAWFLLIALTLAGCSSDAIPSAPKTTTAVESPTGSDARRYAATRAAEAAPSEQSGQTSVVPATPLPQDGTGPGLGGDKYAYLEESDFLSVSDAPLSTFSIDVDTASYSKTRAYLLDHRTLPPPDAVRIEELINYFDYAYPGPDDDHPFAVHLETAGCPWQTAHRLVRIGIQGRRTENDRPPSNLVFLVDVSGSMAPANKLPLVQRSLAMLVKHLGENDRVSIVVYAGAAGLVLPPTCGMEQGKILAAIQNLLAGGSTNGGHGIQLAYRLAQENFVKGGVNRVLLCTDGDFNVGTTSNSDLVRLAQDKAKAGVYLSILGFGFGNHNDALLEQIAGKANGNYAFIDSEQEARKVLVEQMQGTLVTIAKDVKLQVEFNPATVAAYRLIGYENRRLANRDFNDDTKDAGDIGAGHSVTALYEIVPTSASGMRQLPGDSRLSPRPAVDPLKYSAGNSVGNALPGVSTTTDPVGNALRGVPGTPADSAPPTHSTELLTLKLRYQPPTGGPSTLLTHPLRDSDASFTAASPDLQFAAAVASFGMLLRNSRHKGDASFAAVLETAAASQGPDKRGLRGEFLTLVKAAQQLTGEKVGSVPAIWRPNQTWPIPARPHQPIAFQQQHAPAWLGFTLGLAAGLLLIAAITLSALALARFTHHPIAFPAPRPITMKTS